MKIRDIMAAKGGNLSWCKPMADKSDNTIVMMEGKAINAVFDGVEFSDYRREELDKAISAYAKSVEDYEWRHDIGMSDLDIALGNMAEGDCANCPFSNVCDVMNEEVDDDGNW